MIINFPKNSLGSFNPIVINNLKLDADHRSTIKDEKIYGFEPIGTGMNALLTSVFTVTPTTPLGYIDRHTSATVHTTNYTLWCKIFLRFKISITDYKKDDFVQLEITIVQRSLEESALNQPLVVPNGHKVPNTTPLKPGDHLYGILHKYVDCLDISYCQYQQCELSGETIKESTPTNSDKQDTNLFSNIPKAPQTVEEVPKVAEAGLDLLIHIHKVLAVSEFGNELLKRVNTGYDNNCEIAIRATGEVISDTNIHRQLEDSAKLLKKELVRIINASKSAFS